MQIEIITYLLVVSDDGVLIVKMITN